MGRNIIVILLVFILCCGCKGQDTNSNGSVTSGNVTNENECVNQIDDTRVYRKILCASLGQTVAIKADGTIVVAGLKAYERTPDEMYDVSEWHDIVDVDCIYQYTVATDDNGKVYVANDSNLEYAFKYMVDLPRVKSAAIDGECVVLLCEDGSIKVYGTNAGTYKYIKNMQEIVKLNIAYGKGIMGLTKDGTILFSPREWGIFSISEVTKRENILDVTNGSGFCVVLYKDNTCELIGTNPRGKCDISDWKDIVAISADGECIVGLKKDGTCVATGDNTYGQCNVSDWRDIVAVATSGEHTVGIKKDGTAVAVGDNRRGQCEVSEWNGLRVSR